MASFQVATEDERPYVSDGRLFVRELAVVGASYTLQVAPRGGHSWPLWEQQLVDWLRWFLGTNQGKQGSRCAGCPASS